VKNKLFKVMHIILAMLKNLAAKGNVQCNLAVTIQQR